MVAPQVHHGDARLVEDAQLALEVVLPRGVLERRDVVGPDVEEGGHVEAEPQHAVVLERLARHLHHHARQAAFGRVGEVAPEVWRLGCGVDALHALDAVERLDGAEKSGPRGGQRAAICGRVQDRAQHVGRGRLALGAREADDLEPLVGVAPRRGRDVRHRAAHVAAGEARHLRMGGRQLVGQALLGEVRHAPGLEREVEVVGLERGALAHEDVAGRGLARVAVAAADGRVARAVEARRAHEEPLALKQGADLVQCDIHVAQYTGPARRRAPGAVPPRYEQAPPRRRGAARDPPRGYDGRTVGPIPRRPSWREEHGFAS